jgi:hypothetical protein
MKTTTTIALLVISSFHVNAQIKINAGEKVKQVKKQVESKVVLPKTTNSNTELVAGLKEALSVGASKSIQSLGIRDGFFKSPEVKIPLPKEASNVESTLRKFGFGKSVDQCIESLNRSAEDAVSTSTEIFLTTIKDMSVDDAVGIIKGGDHAATNYLRFETIDSIKARMMPIIEASLKKTDATRYWKDVFTNYNRLTRNKVNPDLKSYVAEKAIDGLFLLIAKEEEAIRKDPLARTSELLRKTFGGNN